MQQLNISQNGQLGFIAKNNTQTFTNTIEERLPFNCDFKIKLSV